MVDALTENFLIGVAINLFPESKTGDSVNDRTTVNTRDLFRMVGVFQGYVINGSNTKILLDFYLYNVLGKVFYCTIPK
jgi:hypothetical protein